MQNTIKTNGKMTLTFNPQKYQDLLVKYQPKLIKTEAENEVALKVIEELMHKKDKSLEENELYKLLILLVEKFEKEYYLAGKTATNESILQLLMEQQNITTEDLIEIIGSKEMVLNVINGQQNIDKQQASKVSKFFPCFH